MRIPIVYKEKVLNIDFRYDLFVGQCIVTELKTVQEMTNVFEAKLLTYMKLLKAPKGILINFILVLNRFAIAKMFRTSYTRKNQV